MDFLINDKRTTVNQVDYSAYINVEGGANFRQISTAGALNKGEC